MLDAVDDDQLLGLVDFVDDLAHATASRAQPGEFALQLSAESMRVVEECSEHELNNGGCGAFGESVQLTLCGTGQAEREGRLSSFRYQPDTGMQWPHRRHDRPLPSRSMSRPFSDYMEQCLYAPEDGFYTSGRGVAGGRGGDFITSPEVGPLFGAVLARAIDRWWRDEGEPSHLPVIDLGTGPGGLLRALEVADPPCSVAWSLIGVDRAVGLDAVAPDVDLGGAIVLANELLDNVPFDIGVRRHGVDHRLMVEGDPPGHTTTWEPLDHRLEIEVADDVAFPLLSGARALVEHILAQEPRRLVAFDYAGLDTRELAERGGWLRTYRQHQRGEDPFIEPGQWDITTDIAVDQLPAPDRVTSQADFLTGHGIADLVAEGRSYWKRHASAPDLQAMRMRSRVRESEALLDPAGLGGFRCLEWAGPTSQGRHPRK